MHRRLTSLLENVHIQVICSKNDHLGVTRYTSSIDEPVRWSILWLCCYLLPAWKLPFHKSDVYAVLSCGTFNIYYKRILCFRACVRGICDDVLVQVCLVPVEKCYWFLFAEDQNNDDSTTIIIRRLQYCCLTRWLHQTVILLLKMEFRV